MPRDRNIYPLFLSISSVFLPAKTRQSWGCLCKCRYRISWPDLSYSLHLNIHIKPLSGGNAFFNRKESKHTTTNSHSAVPFSLSPLFRQFGKIVKYLPFWFCVAYGSHKNGQWLFSAVNGSFLWMIIRKFLCFSKWKLALLAQTSKPFCTWTYDTEAVSNFQPGNCETSQ